MLDPRADVYAFVLFYFGSLSGIFTRDFFIRDFYSGSYSLFGVVLAMCFCLECLFVVLRIYCFRIFKFLYNRSCVLVSLYDFFQFFIYLFFINFLAGTLYELSPVYVHICSLAVTDLRTFTQPDTLSRSCPASFTHILLTRSFTCIILSITHSYFNHSFTHILPTHSV